MDVALVTLRNSARSTSVPSKTFSAMAAGAAVLAVAPSGSDLAETVRLASCGAVVDPGDGPGVARFVQTVLGDPGLLASYQAASTAAVRDRYGIPALARRWTAFLEETVVE
jgi:glycosyltransferase involved in cell wall biosynthesis